MNIGIITFHSALNQGAVLQAYALQTLLTSWGHNIEFIDYAPRHKYSYRDFVSKSPKLLIEKLKNQLYGYLYRRNNHGFNNILNVGKQHYNTWAELREIPPVYDIYITGSDQVWNFLYELNYAFLLDFVPIGKPKVAYAASLGQCRIPEKLHRELIEKLSDFRAISVREANGTAFINSLMRGSGIVATQVLDPTLLIHKRYYDKILEKSCCPKVYIVAYMLSMLEKGHEKVLRYISRTLSLPIENLRNPTSCLHLYFAKNRIVRPTQFLGYIKGSQFVVCGSFHATVFSLIFHRPFIVLVPSNLKNCGGNQRINSLLEPLGLLHHCVYDYDEKVIDGLINEKINWEEIDNIIKEMATESINFLRKNIYE